VKTDTKNLISEFINRSEEISDPRGGLIERPGEGAGGDVRTAAVDKILV